MPALEAAVPPLQLSDVYVSRWKLVFYLHFNQEKVWGFEATWHWGQGRNEWTPPNVGLVTVSRTCTLLVMQILFTCTPDMLYRKTRRETWCARAVECVHKSLCMIELPLHTMASANCSVDVSACVHAMLMPNKL